MLCLLSVNKRVRYQMSKTLTVYISTQITILTAHEHKNHKFSEILQLSGQR